MPTPHKDPWLVYSERYNMGLWGLDFLHPFDGKKYGKALALISKTLGEKRVNGCVITVERAITDAELTVFHTDFFVSLMGRKVPVCRALELMPLRHLPFKVIDKQIIQPMRYAVQGTVQASEYALKDGLAINLGGGYHHATKGNGGGFCLFSDVPVAINLLRKAGTLAENSRVGIIDLDAHQGQGFAKAFAEDDSVRILDVYNADVYPGDKVAKQYTDVCIELHSGCMDEEYLNRLKDALPQFLDEHGPFDLMYYNAGTDIVAKDPLGVMNVSKEGVLERDRMVLNALSSRGTPTVMLTSGGYTKVSHELIANTVLSCFGETPNARISSTMVLL